MPQSKHKFAEGFTLIELLIVVAIIAILAAIAVPNFLEAQMRAKVSRAMADMRSLRTAVEAYCVDNNHYPETDTGAADPTNPGNGGFGFLRLTTPVAFMTSVPRSPFMEDKMGNPGTPKNCNRMVTPLFVRAENWLGGTDTTPADGIDDSYEKDRAVALGGNSLAYNNSGNRAIGGWMMKSVGPNNVDDVNIYNLDARVYDPTNGTVSQGDIIVFGDTSGMAQQKAGS